MGKTKAMVIDGISYVRADSIQDVKPVGTVNSYKDLIGKNILFRNVVYHLIGRVVNVTEDGIFELEDASWVADSGRFGEAIKSGVLDEVEYLGRWFFDGQVKGDFGEWKHDLPLESK